MVFKDIRLDDFFHQECEYNSYILSLSLSIIKGLLCTNNVKKDQGEHKGKISLLSYSIYTGDPGRHFGDRRVTDLDGLLGSPKVGVWQSEIIEPNTPTQH